MSFPTTFKKRVKINPLITCPSQQGKLLWALQVETTVQELIIANNSHKVSSHMRGSTIQILVNGLSNPLLHLL